MWALLVSGMFHTTVTEENVLFSLLILSRDVSGRSGAPGGPVISGIYFHNMVFYIHIGMIAMNIIVNPFTIGVDEASNHSL